MRVLTNLLFKVTLSSMVLTAPAMISGRTNYDGDRLLKDKEAILPFYSSAVISRFIEQPSLTVVPAYKMAEHVAARSMTMVLGSSRTTVAFLTQPTASMRVRRLSRSTPRIG